jgi:hypothetical protein
MKIIYIVFLLVLICQPLMAKEGVNFSIAPKLDFGFGHTTYTMDNVHATDSTGAVVATIKSELKFPLDAIYAGVRAEMFFETLGRKTWFVDAAYSANINNPRGVMTDGDWITPIGGTDFQWSHTESDVDYKFNKFSVHVGYRFYSWEKATTFAVIGYKYQRIVQNDINIKGWQYDLRYDPPPKYIIDTVVHALYYKATYHEPSLGILYDIQFNRQTYLDLSLGYMHVFASDVDDHILRNKLSDASGAGPGFYSSMEFNWAFGPSNAKTKPFINVGGDFSVLHVSTGQTQRWYGDDPITEGEDDTGHVEKNIPHKFTSMLLFVGIRAGLAF